MPNVLSSTVKHTYFVTLSREYPYNTSFHEFTGYYIT